MTPTHVKESLLGRFVKVDDPKVMADTGFEVPYWQLSHDFALAPAKA